MDEMFTEKELKIIKNFKENQSKGIMTNWLSDADFGYSCARGWTRGGDLWVNNEPGFIEEISSFKKKLDQLSIENCYQILRSGDTEFIRCNELSGQDLSGEIFLQIDKNDF